VEVRREGEEEGGEEGREGGRRDKVVETHGSSLRALNPQAAIGIGLSRKSSGTPWVITCGIGKRRREGGREGGRKGGREEWQVSLIHVYSLTQTHSHNHGNIQFPSLYSILFEGVGK